MKRVCNTMPTLLASLSLAACIAACAAGTCSATDYSFFFTVSNDISPEQPSATVTLWAAFAPQQLAFGQSNTSVWSDPDPGSFSDPTELMYQHMSDPGEVSPDGDSVISIRLYQWQWWQNFFADDSNPIAAWSATWTTDDFTPRTVPIWSQSTDFYVYKSLGGDWDNFYGPDFSEAQGLITVVPTPTTAALLAAAGLWGVRRHDRHRVP